MSDHLSLIATEDTHTHTSVSANEADDFLWLHSLTQFQVTVNSTQSYTFRVTSLGSLSDKTVPPVDRDVRSHAGKGLLEKRQTLISICPFTMDKP